MEYCRDLSKYKDEKYITVEFDATIGNPKALVLLDNFRVKDVYDYDLSTSLTGPATVKTGSKSTFSVTVANEGLQPMSDYTVSLIVNGETVDTKTISDELKASEKKTINFDYMVPANAQDTLKVKATVSHDFDMDETNNESKELSVRVLPATYPAVNDLKATQASKGVSLSWSNIAGKKNVITDSFEAYTPWSISGVGDWTLVDRDKNYTYGFGNKFPNQGNPYAYIVFNPSAVGDTGNNLDPHTGSQYMAAFSSSTSANNDWLISPLLSGEAQTVSFWVKTVDDSYGSEAYEVLYSTTDTATTSFQVVNTKTTAPTNWTKITVTLPAGSKYFAIHCVSNNCTMFAVDDVTYEATSIAQVLYYHHGPKTGYGRRTIYYPQYDTNGTPVFVDFSKETYDWDDMLLSYGSSTDASVGTISGTAQQQHAVAQLMRDLGVAVDMNYGESASGTNHGSAATGLQNYFGLKDAKKLDRKAYTEPAWMDIIYQQLNNNLPIVYGGLDAVSGGHSFVFDGYDKDGRVHVNWGWYGEDNGYFYVADLDPYHNGNSFAFNSAQDMIININPDDCRWYHI